MAQLLGGFPSHDELPWFHQASNAYSDSIGSSLVVPPAYEGYYLSNSNEALGTSSCAAPDALGSVQEHGATEYLNVTANRYGNGDPSCEGLDDPSISMLASVSATNKRKNKHLVEEHDIQTRVSLDGHPFD